MQLFEQKGQEREWQDLVDAIETIPHEPPCWNYPDAFYPETYDGPDYYTVQVAKGLCRGCPIASICAGYAIKWEADGIWGGTTPRDRVKLRRLYGIRLPNQHETTNATPQTVEVEEEDEWASN